MAKLILDNVTIEGAEDQTARTAATAANTLAQKAADMFGTLTGGIRVMTTTQYNALTTKDSKTLYVVI